MIALPIPGMGGKVFRPNEIAFLRAKLAAFTQEERDPLTIAQMERRIVVAMRDPKKRKPLKKVPTK
jgi:hypothetical protein